MHMKIAAYIIKRQQSWNPAVTRGSDFILASPQLRRDEWQMKRAIEACDKSRPPRVLPVAACRETGRTHSI
jgi:hypothetical protein